VNLKQETMTTARTRAPLINLESGPQMREYVHIADRIAAEQLGPVLDWGCGWGQISHLLLERGVEVESYEYREADHLRVTRLTTFPDVEASVSGDPIVLPYPDDQFAAVLSCGVLEHVQYPESSLEELHRVLRPGGRFFVYKLPNRFSYLELIARVAGLYYHGSLPNDRVYDRRRVLDLMTRYGFRVDALRRTNMLPLTIAGALATRHADRIWRWNQTLGRMPVLNLAATNLEVDATAVDAAA
jgi:cyclopropane fatty-acyl-phospholipid synthase-like methyltransferase